MSSTTWTPPAVSAEARPWRGTLWRMVEAQHVASTMKVVDTRDEQDALESLLDSSKPAPPAATAGLDYLLATPFRYPPRPYGSRFRGPADPGVFYGAQSVHTAAAELGYWRWRFLQDAIDLERLEPVPHTAFSVAVATQAVDLRGTPFDVQTAQWTHPSDYAPTQAFARVARDAAVGGIVYRSVRDPDPAWCLALLTPEGFARMQPNATRETWYLAVGPQHAHWRAERRSMMFSMTRWAEARR